MRIVQIIPSLPPAVGGVGDYGRLLAKQLHKDFGIETHFVVGNPNWTGAGRIEGFTADRVNSRTRNSLLSILEIKDVDAVLLHHSGYGYARRGCPIWLVDGLARWLRGPSRGRLVTMFHEVYAFGPPWTSSFWLSPIQRHLGARLVKLSDQVVTNLNAYSGLIAQISRSKYLDIPCLPVFSTIGEPDEVSSLGCRTPQMIVFGGSAKRKRIYQNFQPDLIRACRRTKSEIILDIGPSTGLDLTEIDGIRVSELGVLPASEIMRVLQGSRAGFLADSPEYLGKSSIFAAYCAHGMITVVSATNSNTNDGLVSGQHYMLASNICTHEELETLQNIASQAFTWYHQHNLRAQGMAFASYITAK